MMITTPLPQKQKQNNNKTKRGLNYNLECKSNLNTIKYNTYSDWI